MAFVQRKIEISVKLATNSQTNQPNKFTDSGTDQTTIKNLRTSVRISNSGSPSGSRARVMVWGMTPSKMNQMSTLGLVFNVVPLNTITIKAGDSSIALATVYSGTIVAGYADYNSSPDVPFIFEANSGLGDAVSPADPSSFQGAADVSTIMSGFARQLNLGFEDGLTSPITLENCYYPGNLRTQMQACAEEAHVNAEIVNGNTLAIWPIGGVRKDGGTPPIVSAKTGMIGYPSFTQNGIMFRTLFNPKISFGGSIKVESSTLDNILSAQKITNSVRIPTNSQWGVLKLDLALDAQVPRGHWMSTIQAFNPQYPKLIEK